ncbi:metal-dependent hydrolase family protein [Brucella pseudogrignonensis]|uniref:metal-dependent hydrolase family protein n=1 Tax=Brucella pseudogrignonensis TaxID=419475 RepID=UPI00124D53A5|nr:amidohydrolase family protein [Brucella pseudogrignonensis]KAB2686101.1 amidohydrolase family protein [Brucella pseudogrignonensis]
MITILENANVVDVENGSILADQNIVLENGFIRELNEANPSHSDANRIDLEGSYVIPGLIDAHVHVTAYTANLGELPRQSPMYVAARAAKVLDGMLSRGFTTVRDVGGAEFGLAQSVEERLISGPRLLYGGKALSASGGHGDHRSMGVDRSDETYAQVSLGRRCDGVDEVRRAARDEIRRGAHHIKIMANGGISSPTDRITSDQFSEEEIAAIVDEANMANLYVVSHTYTARSVARAVRNGVRSIEHGNLLDEETVALMKGAGSYLTPTLSCFRALAEVGAESGFPKDRMDKIKLVLDSGLHAVELAYRAGVPMAYGTDLIGPMHSRQLHEFELRADVVPPLDLLRAATSTAAELVRLEHEIGHVKENYRADLNILSANPLDKGVLESFVDHLQLVIQGGAVVKSYLL